MADILAADGLRLARIGRMRDARAQFRAALAFEPDHFDALQNLGVIALQSGQPDEALSCLKSAAALRPEAYEVHNNLSIACCALGRNAEAIEHYEVMVSLRPDDRRAVERLVQLLFGELRALEALNAVEAVARLRPDLGYAHGMHAAVLRTFGRTNEALAAAERAIAAEPNNAQHYYLLAQLKRFEAGEPHLVAMEDLHRRAYMISPPDRVALLFALAKAYRDTSDEARSFDHLDEANRLARTRVRYDEAQEMALFARVKDVFSPSLLREKAGLGDPSRTPVFILGMPRSGTTLIEQILSSHPRVAGAGEIDVTPRIVWRVVPSFPEGIGRMTGDALARVAGKYLAGVGKLAASADRVTDKSLTNVLFAGLLHLALPNARFIHVVRDPVQTCLSCYSLNFGDGLNFTYDLAELGRYYRAHEDLAAHWEHVFAPGAIITVRHEDLVANPEREMRRMLSYIGVAWDAACLSPEKAERAVFTASATQVRAPVAYSTSGYRAVPQGRLDVLARELGDFARRA